MIVVLDMVSHSHAWDWIKNKGNPQACTMNQNGTKFVDFIHGSKFRTSSASNKFRLQTFIILNLQHTPGPQVQDFHILPPFMSSFLDAVFLRVWCVNDTSKKQEMSLTEPRCQTVPIWLGEVAAMVDTQALRFISARGKIQRNSKMEYGPCIWFVSVRLL